MPSGVSENSFAPIPAIRGGLNEPRDATPKPTFAPEFSAR